MKANHRKTVVTLTITIFFLLLLTIRPLTLWAEPDSRALKAAWQQANDIGEYQFITEIIQVTHPLPVLSNAGKSSQTERLYIEGGANITAETMDLKLWSEGGNAQLGQGAIELQVVNGRTLGRVNNEEWQEVDNVTDFFAPNSDPFHFLNAAENINQLAPQTQAGMPITRYTFDINSDTFARQMRQQMEAQLAREGNPLPPGIQLDVPRLYTDMTGHGELWVSNDGLPLRQIIQLQFPDSAKEQVDVEITTDFTEWGQPKTTAAISSRAATLFWQAESHITASALQILPYLFFLAFTIVLFLFRRKKLISGFFAIFLIVIMVTTPLLQGEQAHAANEYRSNLLGKSTNSSEEQKLPAAPAFNPKLDPLLSVPLQTSDVTSDTLDVFYDDGLDDDNDGLSNAQETEFYGTDPRLADSDDDRLSDGIEINELGTNPLNADTDGDNLPDWAEVQGIVTGDGNRWYLDPLVGDSGGNGEADGTACRMADADTLDCADTDGNNVPDVYDLDNDGDGVPDTVDSAPTAQRGDPATGLISQTFKLDLNNVTANEPIYVDFQLRPTNPDHLWYSLSKLDWPENDSQGQIQSVFTTTFKSGEPGDMRLVPMLEIEMAGTPLPLPMTNAQTSLTLSGIVAGTAVFTQQVNDVQLSLALSDVNPYNTAVYNTTCAQIDDTSTPLYDLGSMGDGDTAVINNIDLPQTIADGNHSLLLTNASNETTCQAIPNIINGGYSDQMVDLATLQTYGISVREKDNIGGLLAYVPLTLLYEQAGNTPVAFTGRMFYQPGQADFGAVEQTRLSWMVMTKTDRCLPMPSDFDPDPDTTGQNDETEAEKVQAWCSDIANWVENGTSVVHAYYDDWYLTGLSVQRNLGLKTAVIYEDPTYSAAQPSYDPTGFNDDNLWSMALGLDASFMAGRDGGTGTRNLTIDDIAPRWDKNSNGSATSTERWQLPQDAFLVETFNFPDSSGVAALAQIHAYDILENQFTAQAQSGGIQDPTLLFLQENRLRSISLDYDELITDIDNNGATFDIANSELMPELVIASMNWVPYQFNGSWQPYDLTQYWIDKGNDMDAALALTPDWSAEDVTGASLIARAYYMSVAAGVSQVVEIDGLAAYLPSYIADAEMQTLLTDTNPLLGIGKAVKNVVSKSISALTKIIGKDFIVGGAVGGIFKYPTLLQNTQKTLLGNNRGAVNLGKGEMTLASLAKALGTDAKLAGADGLALLKRQARWSDGLGYASTVLSAAAAVTGVIAAGVAFFDANAAKIIGIVGNTIAFVASSLSIASLILKLQVTTTLNGLTSFGKVLSHIKGLDKISKASIIFFVIGQVLTFGLFVFSVVASAIRFGSLAFDQMLANFVAGVIVAVLFLAIGAIPIIGQLIAAIVALIDLIVTTICSFIPSENDTETGAVVRDYLCGGITGLLTKLVSWLIYDQTPLIKLDQADRLNMTNFDFGLGSPNLGYSDGNQLHLAADVQTALYRNDIDSIEDVSPFIVYRYQFNDKNIKATTLAYTMTTSTADIHDPLSINSMSSDWQPPQAGGFAEDSNFVVTRAVDNGGNVQLQTGVNRGHTLWLAEGQAYNVQECIMVPALPSPLPVCWLRVDKDTQHLDLSEMLIFDVFPATIDGFYQLTAVSNGGYTLAWDDKFPMLQDADGDGLISSAFGGPDPADHTPDYDGDGLSDFFELQQSVTNPQLADSDGDGLCDNQEVHAGTDPNRVDSDGDGLLDSDEVFHQDICDGDSDGDSDEWLGGWEFVYAFDGATPLRTLVVPSPFTVNPDGDAYLDSLERTYGFNPNVPSSGSILDLSSEVDANVVQPGTTINYTAELENNLRSNHALGLLDVQFNTAVSANTVPPFAFNLPPNSSVSTNGQVTIDPAIIQSQEVTMTNRAGALIVDPLQAVNGRSLWLRMNDTPTGDPRIFADDSLNNWEVSCDVANCPTHGVAGYKSNGLQFGQDQLVSTTDSIDAIGLTNTGFTVDLWLYPTRTDISTYLLGSGNLFNGTSLAWGLDNGRISLFADGATVMETTGTPLTANRWHHLTWRYDGFTQANTFFLDGTAILTTTYDLTTTLSVNANNTLFIFGAVHTVNMDEYSIYPFPLADSAIAAIGYDRVFYARGETPFSGTRPITIQDDSSYHNNMTCEEHPDFPSRFCPSIDNVAAVDRGYRYYNSESFDTMPVWVEPSPNLDLSGNNGNFSIAAWVSPIEGIGSEGSGYVMGYGNPSYLYPTLRVDRTSGAGDGSTDLTLSIGISNEAGTTCAAETHYNVFLNSAWVHVSVVFDGLHFTFYVNNDPVDAVGVTYSNGGTDCQGVTPRSETQFYLGGFGDRYDDNVNGYQFRGNPYGGGVDELQILNYALSGEEVADIYWDELPIMDLRLDEPPASDVFADRAISGFDATCALVGGFCPFSGLPGRDNQAVRFDGVNDAMSIANTSQLGMLNSSFTLSAWINPSATSARGGVIGNANASDAANDLFFGLDFDLPQFKLGNNEVLAPSSVTRNEWTHITGRYAYDAVDGDGTLSLFVDGVLVATSMNVSPLATPNSLRLGRKESEYFNGMIDSVQVYREALTDAEIAELVLQAPRVNLHLDDPFGATSLTNSGDPAFSATCNGATCPQADIKGRVYGGVTLDGENDVITIPDTNGDLLGFGSYSIGLWVMPTQQKSIRQALFGKDTVDVDFYTYIEPNSMRVGFGVGYGNCNNLITASSTGALTENVWNHVMLIHDENEATARLYLNGSLDVELAVTPPLCHTNDPLILGDSDAHLPFAGGMDEVVLYAAALSERDVAELYSYQQAWFDTRVGHKITIDADDPTVTLNVTAPFLPNQDKILAVSASDPTSEIVSVEYNVNGNGWQAATADVKAWLFNFVPTGSGNYTIELRATDEAGNIGSSNHTINVDGEGPVLGAVNVEGETAVPAPFDTIQDAWAVNLSGSVTSADSPLDSVTVNLFDDLGASVSGVHTTTVNGGVWQIDYPFPTQPNGIYTTSVRALDVVGNFTVRNVLAHVDGTPPVAEISYTGPYTTTIANGVVLTGTVAESGITSTISMVEIGFHPTGYNDLSSVQVLKDNNILHLPLDDNPGTITATEITFVDLSKLATAATCSGNDCPETAVRGWLGNAAAFDGVDDVLTASNVASNITRAAYSFGGWVYPHATGSGDDALLAFKGDDTLPSSLLLYRHTTNQFVYWDGTSGEQVSSGTFANEAWHHVWVTIGADNTGTLYVDGNAEATFTTTARPAATDALKLGRAWDGSDYRYFAGLLDDVAVYTSALDAAEIERHYRGYAPLLRLALDEDRLAHGGIVADTSRYTNTAVLTQLSDSNKVEYPLPGAVGAGAYDFGTAYIDVTAQPHFDLSHGEFTQMAWVYPPAAPANNALPIFSGDTNAPTQLYPSLSINNATRLAIAFGDGTTTHNYVTGNILTPNQWNFVAATFDGTTYRFYVDGVLQETTTQFAGSTPYPATMFSIGRATSNGVPIAIPAAGYLDEISLYQQTLSGQQIMALYHQGWQPTTLDAAPQPGAWQYAVPTELRGSYQIQLRSSDVFNQSFGSGDNSRWDGYIDTAISYDLTVALDGTGNGSVSSAPSGITCESDCVETYDQGTAVTLTAVAGADSSFMGWSGACIGADDCVVTITETKNVTATFALGTNALTVLIDGNGNGSVNSVPTGIDCGGDCAELFDYGTVVTLTAVADAGSSFLGWSGACIGAGDCVITMEEARTVTANFALGTNVLTILKDGTGNGTVSSVPTGINCGDDCAELYNPGTVVTLTAVAETGSTFTGWHGVCSDTTNCTVTMDAAQSVTATFTLDRHDLTVNIEGTGSGIVNSDPIGIACESDCSETYDYGTVVTLTAVTDPLSSFLGWSGDCTGTTDCLIMIDAAQNVTATFATYTVFLPVVLNNYVAAPDLVVEDIVVTANSLELVIRNVGDKVVSDAFWVDVYLNPTMAPTAVNQTWLTVGTSGLVWGVDSNALPLNPGESMKLSVGDAYYHAELSNWNGVLTPGTIIYAQVDSADADTDYGAIQETHEINGTPYNNILGPVTVLNRIMIQKDGLIQTRRNADQMLPNRLEIDMAR